MKNNVSLLSAVGRVPKTVASRTEKCAIRNRVKLSEVSNSGLPVGGNS